MRAARMATEIGMRVVGVIENMSFLVGTGQELFGAGGGDALSQELNVPLLAQIPLDPRLRVAADLGEPLVAVEPECETAGSIVALAEAISATARRPGGILKALPVLK